MAQRQALEPQSAWAATETPLQRATCKWVGITTVAVFVVAAVLAFVVPADFYNVAVQFELWHAAATAGLLLVGSRGIRLGRVLGSLGVAVGVIYLAPVMFLTGMLFLMPEGMDTALERVGGMLAYCTVLLAYYGIALAFVRRANLAAQNAGRPAPQS